MLAEFLSTQNGSRPFEQRTTLEKEKTKRDREGVLGLLNTGCQIKFEFQTNIK